MRWNKRVSLAVSAILLAFGVGFLPARAFAMQPQWVEDQVSFQADGMTIYGTYRHPAEQRAKMPAALLIAGSGPTDRNGNDARLQNINTLKTLADWLSENGVASLRYDKVLSGQTGAGRYAGHIGQLGADSYQLDAAAALRFLAVQPGVDQQHLMTIGHSEGALFALQLANGTIADVPHVRAVGLLEPLSSRYLDMLSKQITAQIDAQVQAGNITPERAAEVKAALAGAIQSLRTTGTVPAQLPANLSAVFSPINARFLSTMDRYDPQQMAAQLEPHTPVLVSCSDADIQVACGDVQRVRSGLEMSHADITFVNLHGVDHMLKQDASRTGNNYNSDLPFSFELHARLAVFVWLKLHSWPW